MRFRIEMQDGLARTGRIGEVRTPHLIDLRNNREVEFFKGMSERKAPDVAEGLFPEALEFLRKDGFVKKIILRGAYPKEFVKLLIGRSDFRFPLYIPLIATPQNLSLLLYSGADVVDNACALSKAHEGVYLTEVGEFELRNLRELPCTCPACLNRDRYRKDYDFLADHNTHAIKRELILAVKMLESGRLRELVETRVKSDSELTAILRLIDNEVKESAFFPRFRRSVMLPTSEDSINRPEVDYYFKKMFEVYEPASHLCLLIPCSARKPYMTSKSHRVLRSRLGKSIRGVNEIIISSPFVSPREFELIYPVSFYDTPTTGMWSEWEIEFVASRLSPLLEKFEKVYAYLHGGYREVAERASKISGVDVEFVDDAGELRRKLENEETQEFDLYLEIFRHMMRYQFDTEFEIDRVKGRYPNLEFFRGERVARVDTRYGNLDIYGELAIHLKENSIYSVEIEEFDVKGTIFSVGVRRASRSIRPNDVVVYHNSGTVGVGRALIPGRLMGMVDGKAVESRRKVISKN